MTTEMNTVIEALLSIGSIIVAGIMLILFIELTGLSKSKCFRCPMFTQCIKNHLPLCFPYEKSNKQNKDTSCQHQSSQSSKPKS